MVRTQFVVSLLIFVSTFSDAAVTRIDVQRRETYAGPGFGSAGAYERIVGRFHGELDPEHPLNKGIVDIGLAPRNARGRVEYSSDLDIIKPVDMAKGNGALLYDVNNRGNKIALGSFNDAPSGNNPVKPDDLEAGDLLFFTTVAPGPTHVAIAIGGDQFVHAPSSTGVVRVERLSTRYWATRYLGARRID